MEYQYLFEPYIVFAVNRSSVNESSFDPPVAFDERLLDRFMDKIQFDQEYAALG